MESMSNDGNVLYSEATIANEDRNHLKDVWLMDLGAIWRMTP